MRYWQPIIVISCLILCSAGCNVVSAKTVPSLESSITSMIKSSLPEATVGVVIQDLKTGNVLYDYHGSKHFLPASTAKLFTAAAALKELGPDYVYDTAIYYNPKGGDVALKFSGDPSLELSMLQSLLKKLQQAHITVITGDLWIDDSVFQGPLLGHGWTWDSTSWYHAAPISAIIIDRNQFGITLFPAREVGGNVEVKLEQPYPGAKLRSLKARIRSVSLEDSETLCQISAEVDDENNAKLRGCWPINTEPTHLYLAIKNPRAHAKKLILESLAKLNIKLDGKVNFGKVPVGLVKLAHHESKPLHELLNPVLGESNNLYAECLSKSLGAKVFGIGSFKTGALAMQQVLASSTGIDFTHTRLVDGSGASRYNLVTPLQLSKLLYSMHREPQLLNYFREALPIRDNIRAKTGTLHGVSALSGYLNTKSNRELIVTIMINHAMEKGPALKKFENDLCDYLVDKL